MQLSRIGMVELREADADFMKTTGSKELDPVGARANQRVAKLTGYKGKTVSNDSVMGGQYHKPENTILWGKMPTSRHISAVKRAQVSDSLGTERRIGDMAAKGSNDYSGLAPRTKRVIGIVNKQSKRSVYPLMHEQLHGVQPELTSDLHNASAKMGKWRPGDSEHPKDLHREVTRANLRAEAAANSFVNPRLGKKSVRNQTARISMAQKLKTARAEHAYDPEFRKSITSRWKDFQKAGGMTPKGVAAKAHLRLSIARRGCLQEAGLAKSLHAMDGPMFQTYRRWTAPSKDDKKKKHKESMFLYGLLREAYIGARRMRLEQQALQRSKAKPPNPTKQPDWLPRNLVAKSEQLKRDAKLKQLRANDAPRDVPKPKGPKVDLTRPVQSDPWNRKGVDWAAHSKEQAKRRQAFKDTAKDYGKKALVGTGVAASIPFLALGAPYASKQAESSAVGRCNLMEMRADVKRMLRHPGVTDVGGATSAAANLTPKGSLHGQGMSMIDTYQDKSWGAAQARERGLFKARSRGLGKSYRLGAGGADSTRNNWFLRDDAVRQSRKTGDNAKHTAKLQARQENESTMKARTKYEANKKAGAAAQESIGIVGRSILMESRRRV